MSYKKRRPSDKFDGAFYRAAYNVQNQNYSNACKFIKMARRTLESELTMKPESYNRAYNAVFYAQLLSELEEVMKHKGADRNRQSQIYDMWETRLIGAPYGPNKTGKLGKSPTLFIQGIKSLIGNSGQKSANRKQWGYSIPSNRKQGF